MKILIFSIGFSLAISALAQEVPVANWSGKLILPKVSERRSDGGIFFQVENAPANYIALKGKKVWLKFDMSQRTQSSIRFTQNSMDVNFNATAQKVANDPVLPKRVNAWKKVSPLEGLVAGHNVDDLQGEVVNPKVLSTSLGTELVINEDPILLDGSSQVLARFERAIDNEHYEVKYYNPATRNFSGKSEIVKLDFQKGIEGGFGENHSIAGIENHYTNQFGWNIYGDRINGKFVVKAIDPYELTSWNKDLSSTTYSKNKLKSLLQDYWSIDSSLKTKVRQFVLSDKNAQPQLGDQFLAVHAFGSWDNNGMMLGYYRGHASLGKAEMVIHPISGELTSKLVYYQIYNQSLRGLFAAKYHSHAYTGNLYRGRMFYRPITDALVRLPKSWTENYSVGNETTNLAKNLFADLEDMQRNYRLGFGNGITQITSVSSCVHDSGNILIKALNNSVSFLNSEKKVNSAQDIKMISKAMGPVVEPPASFRNADLIPAEVDTRKETLDLVRKNMTITVPRNFQDELIKALMKTDSNLILIHQTVQTGTNMPEIVPHAPDQISLLKILTKFLGQKF